MSVVADLRHELDPSARIAEQQYGRSLNLAYNMGRVAVEGPLHEYEGQAMQATRELTSTVYEAISSDVEFGREIRVTKFDTMKISNGRVVSSSGQPMVEIVGNGYLAAKKSPNPVMRIEERRAGNDLDLCLDVDAMVNGNLDCNTIFAISASPKQGIEEHGLRAMQEVGYEDGLNYVQMYHLSEAGGLDTGSLSFFAETKDIIKALKTLGVEIPDDVRDDDVIKYAYKANFTDEGARQFAIELREACEPGAKDKINSVEVLDQCRSEVDMAMQGAYLEIGKSLYLARKTREMQQLVEAYANYSDAYSDQKRQEIDRLKDSEVFDVEAGSIVYDCLVYSMAEMVRSRLSKDVNGNLKVVNGNTASGTFYDFMPQPTDFYEMIAQWGRVGAQNKRVYSACGGYFEMADQKDPYSRQEAYGLAQTTKSKDEDCEFISKKCPECGTKNVKTLVTKTEISGSCGCKKARC